MPTPSTITGECASAVVDILRWSHGSTTGAATGRAVGHCWHRRRHRQGTRDRSSRGHYQGQPRSMETEPACHACGRPSWGEGHLQWRGSDAEWRVVWWRLVVLRTEQHGVHNESGKSLATSSIQNSTVGQLIYDLWLSCAMSSFLFRLRRKK